MNIVIPMAGRGRRFAQAGYDRPKPFILVDHKTPMIEMVVNNLIPSEVEPQHFIFLCLQDFILAYGDEFKEILEKLALRWPVKFSYDIVEVNAVTEGAACTVLLAKDLINNDEELIIANCDQLVRDPDYIKASTDWYRHKNADGGILCFLNESPKWSYCRMSGEKVTEVVEKQVVSNLATVGIYYYRKGSMFVDAAETMISRNFRVNGEFYVAPAYNEMVCRNMKVIPYMVNDMVGLGTPEDLRDYQERIGETFQS